MDIARECGLEDIADFIASYRSLPRGESHAHDRVKSRILLIGVPVRESAPIFCVTLT